MLDFSTACGKLAKNLEALIEKTQMWPNGDKKPSLAVSPSPVRVPVEVDALMPTVLCAPTVLNGQWVKPETVTQKPNETSHREGLFSEVLQSFGLISY